MGYLPLGQLRKNINPMTAKNAAAIPLRMIIAHTRIVPIVAIISLSFTGCGGA